MLDNELFNSARKLLLQFCNNLQSIFTGILNEITDSMISKSLYNYNKEEKILFSRLVKEKTEKFAIYSTIMFDMKKENFKNVFDYLKRININQLDIYISQKNTKKSFDMYLY